MSIESDLKQLFEQGAEVAQPHPKAWERIERRVRRAHRLRVLGAAVAAIVAIAASVVVIPRFAENEPRGFINPGPVIGTTPSEGPTGTPTSTLSPLGAVPEGWSTYSIDEIGLAFAYPPLVGNAVRDHHPAEGGVRHSWTIERTDQCMEGVCRSYEFAAVNDGCPATEGWPTYIHHWTENGAEHILTNCRGGGSTSSIQPLRVVTRPDRVRGVIYEATQFFGEGSGFVGARAAVLNFPAGYHPTFEAIAFYFEDPTSLEDIERVLQSVRLSG